jgi:VWFA-related protein
MSMNLRILRSSCMPLLLCCFIATTCFPAEAQKETAQPGSSFSMRVDVDLVTVEVTALDKNGNPAHDLKKEDFRLYEDGKRQDILSFDEVTEGSESSISILEDGAHRGKNVLIVFDDNSIATENIKRTRDSASTFVRGHMRSEDLFAVARFDGSMRIFQNFTSDRAKVLAAIGQSASSIPMGFLGGHLELLASLEKINYSLAHMKGQKSVLIYCQAYSSLRSGGSATSLPMDTAGSFGDFRSGGTGWAATGTLALGSSGGGSGIYAKVLDSAKKSNIIFYTIDPGDGGSPGLPAISQFASKSGGFSIYNTYNLNAELDKLDQQISNYYILGFQSNNPKHDGAFRKLLVKTDVKGVTLRHRPGYLDRSPVDVLASSRQENILLSALASPKSAIQLPIAFRPMYFYDLPRTPKVLIAAKIPMEKIAFRKNGGQLISDLNIMGAAYAEDGSIAARFSETLPISIEKEKEVEFRKSSLAYRNYFRLRAGKYRLKLAVSDESNRIGTIEQNLEIPAFQEKGFRCSSIVLVEQTSNMPDLIKNLQTQMLDENDPLVYSGAQIEPSIDNKLPADSALPVFLRIYNLPGPSDHWDFFAKAKLLDGKGSETALDRFPLQNAFSPAGKREAVVTLNLPFQKIAPGEYKLQIEISESGSAEIAILATDLQLTR